MKQVWSNTRGLFYLERLREKAMSDHDIVLNGLVTLLVYAALNIQTFILR